MPDDKDLPKKPTFDSIELPEEEGSKPAEINLNPDMGDEGVAASEEIKKAEAAQAEKDQKTKEDKEAADAKALEEKKAADAKAEADKGKTPKQIKTEEDAAEAAKKEEEEKKKKELTPFHQHPDWIKKEKETQELRDQVNELKGQVNAMLSSKGTTKEEKTSAVKSATERMREDNKNGWEPKDRVEEFERYNKYLAEELKAKEDAKAEEAKTSKNELSDIQKEISAAVDSTMSELKLSPADEEKVLKKTNELAQKGVLQANAKTVGDALRLVHDQMKATGEIGVVAKTAEQIAADEEATKKAEEDKKKADEEKKKQDATNARINRNGNAENNGGKTEKKPLAKLRRSLDDVVLEHSQELG